MVSYAKIGSLIYNCLLMIPFGVMSSDLLPDVWPGIQKETCSRRSGCVETLEFMTGRIYLQVICGVAFMYGALLMFEGKLGYFVSMMFMVLTMSKHIIVDGLIPPPPVMAMVGLTLLTIAAAPSPWPKRAYVAFCLVNACTFLANPLMVLTDTFPEITEGSPAFVLGSFCFEVIALYLIMAATVAATPNKAYGLAFSAQLGSAVLLKHVLVDKSGPPLPNIILWVLTTAASWYEVGWKDYSKECEKAVKAGPMKLHGIIVGTNFVPYFLLEMMGISLPMIGFSSLDTSTAYSGSMALLFGMLAVFSAMSAYTEYTGQMEGKLFAMYHYFLSVVIFFWQVQPTTTMFGAAFFSLPHMFTLWTTYLVMTKDSYSKDKEM